MAIFFKITHDYDAVTPQELERYFDPKDPMNIINMENAQKGLNDLRVTYDPPFPGYPPKDGDPLVVPKTGVYTITKRWYDLEKANPEGLKKLEDTLADAETKLENLKSSGGGTRKKTLNKNNKKTRTLCKKKNNFQ